MPTLTEEVRDNFSGTLGSAIAGRVADSGTSPPTWATHVQIVEDPTGKILSAAGGLAAGAVTSGKAWFFLQRNLSTADCVVQAVLGLAATSAGNVQATGFFAKATKVWPAGTGSSSISGQDGYQAYQVYAVNDGTWALRKYTSAADDARSVISTLTTSTVRPLPTDGTTRLITGSFTTEGSGVRCVISDATGDIINYLDTAADRITTAGQIGISLYGFNSSNTGFVDSIAGFSSASVTAVSFSGPVPTRNGVVGTAASFANAGFFAGTGTPFAYTNVGAALPAGLTLSSSTGIISGTPTTAGTTSGIIIRATDTASNIANTNSYSIVIAATNAAPTFPGNISNISGNNGSAITPVNVSGQFSDTDTLTYSASPAGTAWPTGLVVNSSTGIISGTSSTTATTTGCKVRATDTASQTVDSNAFNFVIAAAVSNPTFAASGQLKNLNGGILPDGSYSVIIRSKTNLTAAPLAVKTGAALVSGVIPSFAIAGPTAGTEYVYEPVNEADTTIRGLARATPT